MQVEKPGSQRFEKDLLRERPVLPGASAWPRTHYRMGRVAVQARRSGLLVLGVSLLGLVFQMGPTLGLLTTGLCVVVLGLGWWITPGRGARVVIAALASIIVAGVAFSGGAASWQEMAYAYAALLIALKGLEMYRIRDLRVLGVACLVAPLIALLSDHRTPQVILAILCAGGAVWILRVANGNEIGRPVRRVREEMAVVIRALLVAVPLAGLMFFFLPRLDGPLWGTQHTSASTGMSDRMTPGSFDRLLNNPDIAFRAIFNQRLPAQADLYWRGPVLNHYDGSDWTRAETGGDIERPAGGVDVSYTLLLEPQPQPYIPALETPVGYDARQARIGHDLSLIGTENPMRQRSLAMVAVVGGRHGGDRLDATERQIDLDLPLGYNPQTLALARRLRQQSHSIQDYIERVSAYFHQHLVYSLTPPLLGRNRMDDLLFQTHEGYCEHFASAFTVLMRAAEIPSRVVTGYQGGERSNGGHLYKVRQYDAHAWSEVWLDGRGWVRVDPTLFVVAQRERGDAADGLLGAVGGGGLARWFGETWNDWASGFNADTQRYITQRGLQMTGSGHLPDWLAQLLFVGVGMAFLTGCFAVLMWARRRPVALEGDALETAWIQACERARRSVAVPKHATPQRVGRLVLSGLGPNEAAETFAAMASEYAHRQYGPGAAAQESEELRLRRELAQKLRRWRTG